MSLSYKFVYHKGKPYLKVGAYLFSRPEQISASNRYLKYMKQKKVKKKKRKSRR